MIFIGYRRDDSPGDVGRLHERLVDAFGAEQVFRDIDNLLPGVEFAKRISTALDGCRVFLAVIGPRWLDARGASGTRRLIEEHDFVRTEIETALERNIEVIPVLLGGAALPTREALPQSIRTLSDRHVLSIRHDPDFRGDMGKLIGCLKAHGFSPGSPASRSELWSARSNTRDVEELRRFEETFVGTAEAFYARRRRDYVNSWNEICVGDYDLTALENWLYEKINGFELTRHGGRFDGVRMVRLPRALTPGEHDQLWNLLCSVLEKVDHFLDSKPDADLCTDATRLKSRVFEIADLVDPHISLAYEHARNNP